MLRITHFIARTGRWLLGEQLYLTWRKNLYQGLLQASARKLARHIHTRRERKQEQLALDSQRNLLAHQDVRVVFDVGANVGQSAWRYSRCFPRATIYSFEPAPQEFDLLQKRFRGRDSVMAINMAVAATPGVMPFRIYNLRTRSSLLDIELATNQSARMENLVEVPVTTVDAFCGEHAIAHIDILKSDVQGADLFALQGAAGMLARHAISLVIVEICFQTLYQGQGAYHEIFAYMASHGYELYDLYNPHYMSRGQLRWADGLFVNAAIRQRLGY